MHVTWKKSFIGFITFITLRLQDISSAAGGKNHVFMSPCSAAGGKNFVEIIEKGGVSDFPKMRNEKSEKRNGGVKNLDFLRNVIYEWSGP